MNYFIRIDDVGSMTPALVRCVETFLCAELPVSYQVIPLKLTRECADWLRSLKVHFPTLLEFGQHGLRHEMIVKARHVWREFGPERSAELQFEDIAEGKRRLEDALGPIDLFTPPQHKYDRNTLLAAARAGHTLFSAASYTPLPYRAAYSAGGQLGWSSFRHHGLSQHGRLRTEAKLFELSISIAIDNGGTVVTPPKRLSNCVATAAKLTPAAGMMLHPEVYAHSEDMLDQLVDVLRSLGSKNFRTLAGVAHRLKAADSRYSPPDLANTMSWDQTPAMSRRAETHQQGWVSK